MSSLIEKPLYLGPRTVPTEVEVEGVPTTSIMSAVRRHLLAVLIVLLLIPLCTAIVVSLTPSRYAATATVQVQTGTRNLCDIDSVLLAAQWGRTPRPITGTAVRLLGQSGGYVAGAVLTMVEMRKYAAGQLGDDAYLYCRYSSYYGARL
jgi:hypothetical protein